VDRPAHRGELAAPRLTLEYDGGPFAGWARQPGRRTIQDEVEGALATVLREPVELTVAGRTDAGVHALAQVASYAGPVAEPRRLNGVLPPEIAVLACEEAPEGFDARRDATSRAYCYRLLVRRQRSALERGRALWWPHPIEFEALEQCAAVLPGTHEFTAFTPTETKHTHFERDVLNAWWEREGHLWTFWIEADAFMRYMNRVLVGTMLEVAAGRRSLESFAALLEGRPRAEAAPTAKPEGLYFAGAGYGAPVLRGAALASVFERVRGSR
jgi:tRNA pseudouridine38-40 synthase